MRNTRKNLALALVLAMYTNLLFVACSGSLATRTYKTVGVLATTVDAAMTVYGEFYRAGSISPELAVKVKLAYERYQTTADAVLTLVQVILLGKSTGQDVTADEAKLPGLVVDINAAILTLQNNINAATKGNSVALKTFSAEHGVMSMKDLRSMDVAKLGSMRTSLMKSPLRNKSFKAAMAPSGPPL